MDNCPHCGAAVSGEGERGGACSQCGVILASNFEESSGVSRRGLLTYGGGSALATWAGVGLGWWMFLREPTGPEEDVVREYVDALDRSHFYTAQSLFHENAPGRAWSPAEIPDVDRVALTVERTEVVDRVENPNIEGVAELALVHVDITIDDGVRTDLLELAFVVALNEDGEWKLWRDR